MRGEERTGSGGRQPSALQNVARRQHDDQRTGDVQHQIRDVIAGGRPSPQPAVNEKTQRGDRPELAERKTPHALGPFVQEQARPVRPVHGAESPDVPEVVADEIERQAPPEAGERRA